MHPLSTILNNTGNIYSENNRQVKYLIDVTYTFSKDIHMEFGISTFVALSNGDGAGNECGRNLQIS